MLRWQAHELLDSGGQSAGGLLRRGRRLRADRRQQCREVDATELLLRRRLRLLRRRLLRKTANATALHARKAAHALKAGRSRILHAGQSTAAEPEGTQRVDRRWLLLHGGGAEAHQSGRKTAAAAAGLRHGLRHRTARLRGARLERRAIECARRQRRRHTRQRLLIIMRHRRELLLVRKR